MQAINTQDTIRKLQQSIRIAEEQLRKANDQRKRFEKEVSDIRRQRSQSIVTKQIEPFKALRKQRHLNKVVGKLKEAKEQIRLLQVDISYKKRSLDTLYSLQSKINHGDHHALHQWRNLMWRI